MIKFPVFLMLYVSLIPFTGYSQNLTSYNYTIKDGLPSNYIYDALEDQHGFIWFATNLGVSRFDGKNFVNYTTKEGLSDNDIFNIFEDAAGRIWFFPFRNSPCYYWHGKIYSEEQNPNLHVNNHPKIVDEVLSYSEDFLGKNVLFSDSDSVGEIKMRDLMNPNHFFDLGKEYKSLVYNNMFHMTLNKKLLLVSDLYPFLFEVENHKLVKKEEHPLMEGFKTILDTNTILVFHPERNQLSRFKIEQDGLQLQSSYELDGDYRNIYVDRRSKKVFALSKNRQQFDRVLPNGEVKLDIQNPGSKFAERLQDRQGNTWYVSISDGARMVPFNPVYYYNTQTTPTLAESKVLSLAFDLNNLLLGYENKGIDMLTQGSLKHLNYIPNENKRSRIRTLCRTRTGVFAGGDQILLHVGSEGMIFPFSDSIQEQLSVKDLEYSNSKVYISTHAGIYQLDLKSRSLFRLMGSRSTCNYPLKDGKLLSGTLNGLSTVSNGKTKKLFLHPELDKAKISDIKEDAQGLIWIATYGRGVFITNLEEVIQLKEEPSSTNSQDFINSPICRKLHLHSTGTWVSTDKGISQVELLDFEKRKFRIKHFTKAMGLPFEDVNELLIRGDSLYAATSGGLIFFKINQIKPLLAPKIVLDKTWANGKDTALQNGVLLAHDQNNLSFLVAGISLNQGEKVSFKYRLNGSWFYTSSNKIDLVSLSPDDYELLIYALNADLVQSDEPVRFTFAIKPPFYQTNWFYAIIVMAVGLLLYLFFRMRLNRIKVKERMIAQVSELKLRALRAQMNPHFIFNTLTSIQYFFSNKDELTANKYMSDFSRLIRSALDSSRSDYTLLLEELEMLDRYINLEKLRLQKKINYVIKVHNDIKVDRILLPSMLLQPLIENALVHGAQKSPEKEGNLSIDLASKEGRLAIVIKDNGVGINASKAQGNSAGLDIVRQRIETLNKIQQVNIKFTITDLQEIDATLHGTRVEFEMDEMYE